VVISTISSRKTKFTLTKRAHGKNHPVATRLDDLLEYFRHPTNPVIANPWERKASSFISLYRRVVDPLPARLGLDSTSTWFNRDNDQYPWRVLIGEI